MARKKGEADVNRSEAIRAYLAEHPDAKNKDVAAAVSKQLGVEVQPSYISVVKNDGKKDKDGASNSDVDLVKESLLFAFIEMGSLDKAIKAVEGYSEDNIGEFIAKCGGKKKAIAKLKKLQNM